MSAEHRQVIKDLNVKIQHLITAYERMKEKCANLQQSVETRDVQIEELTEIIEKLEEKNKKLQLAEAFKASSEDTRDAKLKIGRIVREIDKCMALLNK